MAQADIGLIGLAVMGQNLVLNMNDHGYTVVVYNRTTAKVDEFLAGPAKGTKVIGAHSLQELFKALKRPRKVMFMVKAGQPVDELIDECLPFLEPGDIVIDGGNSLFTDSSRRMKMLKEKGILFVGTGISGGEEGARHGPSIMPGGNPEAWPHIKEMFQAISAKAETGEPCCDWVGDEGAGHYVKMVHNGIEYGDIQLICEIYDLMKRGLKLPPKRLHEIFADWDRGDLNSYLIEITAKIFTVNDSDGTPLVDKVLDVAGQKGTGKWTVINACELGMPLTLIAEAFYARCLSALKKERDEASRLFTGPSTQFQGDAEEFVQALSQALYASKLISYAQGFMLMRQAKEEYKWEINLGGVAMMWRAGCIIRSRFLAKIKEAYDKNRDLSNLILDPFFQEQIRKSESSWRKVVSTAVQLGIPVPCLSAALAYFDGYRTAKLPANLLQAERDFFGAHTYERIDQPRGKFFHTEWSQA
jgi:6-phosphogluconate dehydrogenase